MSTRRVQGITDVPYVRRVSGHPMERFSTLRDSQPFSNLLRLWDDILEEISKSLCNVTQSIS